MLTVVKQQSFWHKRLCVISFISILEEITGRMDSDKRVADGYLDFKMSPQSFNQGRLDQ